MKMTGRTEGHTGSYKVLWQEFEELLMEGVQRKSYRVVEMLLQHEAMIEETLLKRSPDILREKCPDALVFAAENEFNEFLRLFHKYEYTIPIPHVTNCDCDTCQGDKFGAAVNCMTLLAALSNPVWIALTSQDPFVTSFRMCQLSRQYKDEDDSFEGFYDNISEKNIRLSLRLLDEVKSGKEGARIMGHKQVTLNEEKDVALNFVNLAVEYDQREVVAHPVTQHFVASKVFDDIPNWKTSSLFYKIALVLGLALIYPITTLMHILLPSECCAKWANIGTKPFVKFINGAASFITFLICLAVMGASTEHGLRDGKAPTAIEILVLIWIVGFCFGEMNQIYDGGINNYLSSGWNCIDVCMDVLMVFSYVTWAILCFHNPPYKSDLLKFVDGMFAVAIILSFFRLVYLCQITCYLGLLQLCLGKMVQVIFQFLFIMVVVVCSFSVAMVYLYTASNGPGSKHTHEDEMKNRTWIYLALAKNYDGFSPTVFTLIWAGFGMADIKTLDHFKDGSLIQLWVNILFIVYYGASMIVILNMLIAMMNNSYEQITSNLETEYKFARTILWLEHIGDEQPHPVPFNLIPTLATIKQGFQGLRKLCSGRNPWKERDRDNSVVCGARKSYKELCDKLMERYMLKHGQTSLSDQGGYHDDLSENVPFLQKVKAHIEKWKNFHQSECSCGGNINLGFPGQEEQLYASDDKLSDQSNPSNRNGFYNISCL